MTMGFVAVFLLFGLVISPVASSAQRHLPWLTLVLGLTLAGAGTWLLAGRRLPGLGLRVRGTQVRRGFVPGPALRHRLCSSVPDLHHRALPGRGRLRVPVGIDRRGAPALRRLRRRDGHGRHGGAVAVALARGSIVAGLRRSGRWVGRAVGALLVAVGSYVAWYGAWEIRVLRGGDAGDRVVEVALGLQSSVAALVAGVGLGGRCSFCRSPVSRCVGEPR